MSEIPIDRHIKKIKNQEILTIDDLVEEITKMVDPIFLIAEGGIGKTFFSEKVLLPKLDSKWKLISAEDLTKLTDFLIIDAFDEIPFSKALELIDEITLKELKVVLLSRPEFSEKRVYDYFQKYELVNDDGSNQRIKKFGSGAKDMFSAIDCWLSEKKLPIFLIDFASILSFELLSQGVFSIQKNILFEKIRVYNINNNALLTIDELISSEIFSWKNSLNIKIENKSVANFLTLKFLRKFNGIKNAFINTVKTKTLSLQLRESGKMLMESNWEEKHEMMFNLIFENRYIEMFTSGYKHESQLAIWIKKITKDRVGGLEKWIWDAQSILINAESPALISIDQIANEFNIEIAMEEIGSLNSEDTQKTLCFWISQKLQSWYENKHTPSQEITNFVKKYKDKDTGRYGYRVKLYAITNTKITDEIFEENDHFCGPMEVSLIYAIKNRNKKFVASVAKRPNEIQQRISLMNSLSKEDYVFLFSILRKLDMKREIAEIINKMDRLKDFKLRNWLIEENIFKVPGQLLFVLHKIIRIEMSQELKSKGIEYFNKYIKTKKHKYEYMINHSFKVKSKVNKVEKIHTQKIDKLEIKHHIKHNTVPDWMFHKKGVGFYPKIDDAFIIKNHIDIRPELNQIKKYNPSSLIRDIQIIEKLYQLWQKNFFFKIDNIHPFMFLAIENIQRNRLGGFHYNTNQKDWWSNFSDVDISKVIKEYFENIDVLKDSVNITFYSTKISKYIVEAFNNKMTIDEINNFIEQMFKSPNFDLEHNDLIMRYIFKHREKIPKYKNYIETITFEPTNGNHLVTNHNIILEIMIDAGKFNKNDLLNIITEAFKIVKTYKSFGGGTVYWWNHLFFTLGQRGDGLYHFMRHVKRFGLLKEYLRLLVDTFKYRVINSNEVDTEIYECLNHFSKIKGFYNNFNARNLIEEIVDNKVDAKDISIIWENVMSSAFSQDKTHFSVKMFYKHMNSIFSTHEFVGVFENNILPQISKIVKSIKYQYSAKENIFHSAITENIQSYIYEEFGFLYIQEANPRNLKLSKKSIDFMIINVLDFICVELKTIDDPRLSISKSDELFKQLKSYSKNQFLSTINYLIVIYNQKTIDHLRYEKINKANEIAKVNNFKMVIIDRDRRVDRRKINQNIIIIS